MLQLFLLREEIMDFSSLNPLTSNALNLAARRNDVDTVKRLLKKLNPSCIDNRGWTCLHEAAANDSYESLLLILAHPQCRSLAETHEGHTALYLACRHNSSSKIIKALLESAEDIANYGSTECVTPLHVASALGNVEVMQLLIEHGALVDVQDFDGDTPMHDAAMAKQYEAIATLLHAGADPEIKNEPRYTPFHIACFKGCYNTIQILFPFVNDINQRTVNGDTPLILAVQGNMDDIIQFLLANGADPHIKNEFGEMALNMALSLGYNSIFRILLAQTHIDRINKDIVLFACKPHYFKLEILEALLYHDIGPEFFDFYEPFYITMEQIGDLKPNYAVNPPLNSYLNICEYIFCHSPEKFKEFFYLFLMRGVSVNALDKSECPPLVYLHYCVHETCFPEVFEILIENNCNVDYCTAKNCEVDSCIPDAFLASLTSNPATILVMLPYSLRCEPLNILQFAFDNGVGNRMSVDVQNRLCSLIDSTDPNHIPGWGTQNPSPLKHLCRLKVRSVLRNNNIHTTQQFLSALDSVNLPLIMKNYLRYL